MIWLNDLLRVSTSRHPTGSSADTVVGPVQHADMTVDSDISHTPEPKQIDGCSSESKERMSQTGQDNDGNSSEVYTFPEPGKPHPWPTIGHLGQCYDCVPLVLPKNPNAITLCFAEGVPLAEKRRAAQYAVRNWKQLLHDMALPFDGSIRYCWIEGFEGF